MKFIQQILEILPDAQKETWRNLCEKYPNNIFFEKKDGKILGAAILPATIGDYKVSFELYVVPEARLQGIGTKLFRELEDAARALGVEEFLISSGQQHPIPEIFLASCNFNASFYSINMQLTTPHLVDCTLQMSSLTEERLTEYCDFQQKGFYELRKKNNIHPFYFPITETYRCEKLDTKEDTYLYIHDNAIQGAISIEGAELDGVVVSSDLYEQGIGKQLVSFAAKRVLDRGLVPELWVVENNTAAIALYQKCGFTVKEKHCFYTMSL